jgi:hypothetical protein
MYNPTANDHIIVGVRHAGVRHALPLQAWTHNGTLHVRIPAYDELPANADNGPNLIKVYSISGALIASPQAGTFGVDITIPLPARGVYIVTDGKTVVKVMN